MRDESSCRDEDIQIIDVHSRKRTFWAHPLVEQRQGQFHNTVQELKVRDKMLGNKKESNARGIV